MCSFFFGFGSWTAGSLPDVAGAGYWSIWAVVCGGSARWCQIVRSRRLTADVLLPRTSCSYPKLGIRSSIWLGEFGGLMLGYQPCRIEKQNRKFVRMKKKNSRCS
ncbi:hypothetical protein SETIT_6G199700v2 [Setaria italica]|uniref:Uncharacterized protein n=2 Tax=Setaria TaxID=4554 RepID=K3YKE1_SETIT|nr:hypothetical protein SETIT_6G199700v2 [Setaria italica]TKW11022.1 hypothetical protein SEVIR_6G206800v2 [Setaria viridis]